MNHPPSDNSTASELAFSRAAISLMKGVVYRETDDNTWQSLCNLAPRLREYVSHLGLELMLDEGEGCAYLRQRPSDAAYDELPRLVARRPLSYPVSLLLALLRRRLAEQDAKGGDTRLIVSRDDMVDLMRMFLPPTGNESRLVDKIDAHINKVIDLGFLRRLKNDDARFEVRRILKSFVDAQWLTDFDSKLAAYATQGTASPTGDPE